MREDAAGALAPLTDENIAILVENYRRFRRFLERRTGDGAAAEEILQSAFARAVERGTPASDPEGTVNWFYAVLKNALIDHFRRTGSERRAMEALAAEPGLAGQDDELHAEVCACFRALLPTLKPEYAAMLDRVDLGDEPLAAVAADLGITSNNASVRLFRARAALRKRLERTCGVCATHGCLDCSCAKSR